MKFFKSTTNDRTAQTIEPLNVIPIALQEARTALDNARLDSNKLAIVLSRARAEHRTAEAEHQTAVASLATSESDAVLGNSRPETLIASRTAFTETRDALGFA